jgi:O-acetyl-ADP-ribose deacetylase (regulator of RNase III)
LRGSTRRSLEIANQRGLRSIAFPAVGTGIAHFPIEECARIMLDEVVAHGGNPTSIREVRFVLFGGDAEAAFRDEANRQLMAAEQPRKEDRGEERQRNQR